MQITIQTDADFTPRGKRRANTIAMRGAFGPVTRIRWYVSGLIFRTLPVTPGNVALSREWVDAGSSPDARSLPQAWEALAD